MDLSPFYVPNSGAARTRTCHGIIEKQGACHSKRCRKRCTHRSRSFYRNRRLA
ncbi:MAG: hypothetical protein DWH80_13555 [Planctomycetota bacterium]|nr:MAG: hypothetical protein DWH80_13555 [Planctomycetota bacterium]